MKSRHLALDILCKSVNACPLNWSAWLDLASLCKEKEDLEKLVLPNHWVVDFFRGHMALELQQNDEALEIYGYVELKNWDNLVICFQVTGESFPEILICAGTNGIGTIPHA